MNKKNFTHGIIITAILVAVFVAAAITPADTNVKESQASVIENGASATYSTMIADNEVPLASSPYESGFNVPLWIAIITVSAVLTSVAIYEDCREKRA